MSGFYCDMSTGAGQCAALHNIGDKCSGFQSCQSGSCVQGTCAGNGNICFGVYADVAQPGTVAVGDTVEPLSKGP